MLLLPQYAQSFTSEHIIVPSVCGHAKVVHSRYHRIVCKSFCCYKCRWDWARRNRKTDLIWDVVRYTRQEEIHQIITEIICWDCGQVIVSHRRIPRNRKYCDNCQVKRGLWVKKDAKR